MAQKIVIVSASGKNFLLEGDQASEQYAVTPLPNMLADGWVVQSVTSFGGVSAETAGSVAVLLGKERSSGAKNSRGLADKEGADGSADRNWSRRL